MSRYVVYLEPGEEGGYIAFCPHIPGCVSQGETVDEALVMIKDAIQGCIFSMKKHGEDVPPSVGEAVEKITVVQV